MAFSIIFFQPSTYTYSFAHDGLGEPGSRLYPLKNFRGEFLNQNLYFSTKYSTNLPILDSVNCVLGLVDLTFPRLTL